MWEDNDLIFRPNTLDKWIYEKVYLNDEYMITEDMVRDKVIVDIGCHAGYFSRLCLELGAEIVYAFDIDKENIELAKVNNKKFGNQFRSARIAVWKSGQQTKLTYPDYPVWNGQLNTGGMGVAFGDGDQTVHSIGFDELVGYILKDCKEYPALVKIDAESSEWPIIFTSKYLSKIPIVLGEYHELGGVYDNNDPKALGMPFEKYTLDMLRNHFIFLGYEFRSTRYNQLNIGNFWAVK